MNKWHKSVTLSGKHCTYRGAALRKEHLSTPGNLQHEVLFKKAPNAPSPLVVPALP